MEKFISLIFWFWGMVTVFRPLFMVNPFVTRPVYTANHLHQVYENEVHLKH